jgi:superfamily II DNA or RNA helicase
VLVKLPPLYHINLQEGGNSVLQLILPAHSIDATIEPFSEARVKGFLVRPQDNTPSILAITNYGRPPSSFSHALRLRIETPDPKSKKHIDLSAGRWESHPAQLSLPSSLADYESHALATKDSWRGAFTYRAEDVALKLQGLRPPQIGAIHAVQAHWTVSHEPATIVLPTGVGKTETMLSVLIAELCHRLLVVVPTDVLRSQIGNKFTTLGLLKAPHFQVVSEHAKYPIVGTLNRRPTETDAIDSLFRKCNVVVTTMALASQCSDHVIARMAEHCQHLFIDEAHHVGAPKWKEFRDTFERSRIIQYTATPFRNDDRPVDGRRIFTFPLRKAQEQGYFKRINFVPVTEFNPSRKDKAIAEAAVKQLRADAHLGHILMARAANIGRAKEVFECYRKYSEFNPVQIHTGITSKKERDSIREQIISGKSRIVVCVDMLGEGFDLPELKIAAFHDIRKTLSVTLQLAGRFTREKPNLGSATFIANIADLEVRDELKRLYRHDSDWNTLLPMLGDAQSDSEFSLAEFLGGFQELPDEISLRNVHPAMSTVVYRTRSRSWNPENFSSGLPGYDSFDKVYHSLNAQNNTLVIVTTQRVPVEWAGIDEIYDWDWQLYVLHWDRSNKLLFIHNSSNSGFFKKLAEAVAGEEVEQIRGPEVFRCLAGVNRLKLQNVGLLEQLGRLIRYTMRAGSDVESGLSETQKQKAVKANLFGQGFEEGHRTTIGCSYKGRIWSYRTTDLLQLTHWCRGVGAKLVDQSLDPDEVLKGTLVPEFVSSRPKKVPIAIEWPELFYKEPEACFTFTLRGNEAHLHETSIVLDDPNAEGPLAFSLVSDSSRASFELILRERNGYPDFAIQSVQNSIASVKYRGRSLSVADFFKDEPPTFWFADGSSLTGNEYISLRRHPSPFARDRIESWDWVGTDIRVESQGARRKKISIQFRVIEELKKRTFNVIFDDDDHGESADVVGITEQTDHIDVEFWHCKYSTDDQPGSRIKELYEVCGQAQKSIRWLEKPRDLFTHLLRREPRMSKGKKYTRYQLGDEADLLRIREKADIQRVLLRINIVQPGIARSQIKLEQLELLAVTDNYLMETFAVPFGVVTSV